jgi:hypothetical protein
MVCLVFEQTYLTFRLLLVAFDVTVRGIDYLEGSEFMRFQDASMQVTANNEIDTIDSMFLKIKGIGK